MASLTPVTTPEGKTGAGGRDEPLSPRRSPSAFHIPCPPPKKGHVMSSVDVHAAQNFQGRGSPVLPHPSPPTPPCFPGTASPHFSAGGNRALGPSRLSSCSPPWGVPFPVGNGLASSVSLTVSRAALSADSRVSCPPWIVNPGHGDRRTDTDREYNPHSNDPRYHCYKYTPPKGSWDRRI